MNIESGMPPGKKAFSPLGTQEFLANQESKDLAREERGQTGVVDPGDLIEEARLVHSTLDHQEMQVGGGD
jgi:hypothetical protein